MTNPTPRSTASIGTHYPPGPSGHPIFGCGAEFTKDPLAFYAKVDREYPGGVVRIRAIGGMYFYVVSNPEDVDRVLHSNQKNYTKGTFFNRPVSMLSGNGLLTNEGDPWKRQRRLMQPAFHRQKLAAIADSMTGVALRTAQTWEQAAASGRPIDISESMAAFSLETAGRSLFGIDLASVSKTVARDVRMCFDHVGYLMNTPMAAPHWLPTKRNRRFKAAKANLDRLVYEIIAERRKSSVEFHDLLALLMSAEDDDDGLKMTDVELHDEVLTLLLAGHDTASAALSWTWYLLGRNPVIAGYLQDELDAVLGGRAATGDDLPRLIYTRRVLDESLRLYPPAWGQPRESIAADVLGGYDIPPKAIVTVSQWITHHRADLWPDPERFDPDRFSAERSIGRHPYAYFPFGGGARRCIGDQFASMEMTIALATLAGQFQIELDPTHSVTPDPTFTLRPRDGVKATIRRR